MNVLDHLNLGRTSKTLICSGMLTCKWDMFIPYKCVSVYRDITRFFCERVIILLKNFSLREPFWNYFRAKLSRARNSFRCANFLTNFVVRELLIKLFSVRNLRKM